jgi:hypothetical protein
LQAGGLAHFEMRARESLGGDASSIPRNVADFLLTRAHFLKAQ